MTRRAPHPVPRVAVRTPSPRRQIRATGEREPETSRPLVTVLGVGGAFAILAALAVLF